MNLPRVVLLASVSLVVASTISPVFALEVNLGGISARSGSPNDSATGTNPSGGLSANVNIDLSRSHGNALEVTQGGQLEWRMARRHGGRFTCRA
jgi:hypothetical protein